MKKNKGLLKGIAALALLFSMAFLACESATNGEPGLPGGGEVPQYLEVRADFTVAALGTTTAQFTAWYNGVNITPQNAVNWGVIGDGTETGDGYVNGHRDPNYLRPSGAPLVGYTGPGSSTGTSITGVGVLTVDRYEEAETLTVYATYGGYTATLPVSVGIPYITGLTLGKGTEIGTTNVYKSTYTPTNADTYLVYTRDSIEKTGVIRGADIAEADIKGTVRLNNGSSAVLENNIVLGQEEWLTIYEVPLATGAAANQHVAAIGFVSIPASTHGSSDVRLPTDGFTGTTTSSVTLTQTGAGGVGMAGGNNVTISGGGSIPFTNTTTAAHGGTALRYTVYAVYYDPLGAYGDYDAGSPADYPGLNNKFTPPTGSKRFDANTGAQTVEYTGNWQVIVQYTGAVPGTGPAWGYYAGSGISGTASQVGLNIVDATGFTKAVNRPDDQANALHINLKDGKKFAGESVILSTAGSPFSVSSGNHIIHVSRDSDTDVTLYVTNDGRIALPPQAITISSTAFALGSAPQSSNGFLSLSAADNTYLSIEIGGVTPPYNFAVGTALPTITVSATTNVTGFTFPLGPPITTFADQPLIAGRSFDYTLTWYFVKGGNWVEIPSGYVFSADDLQETVGIRVRTDQNYPKPLLVDITPNDIGGLYPKWSTIEFGQRILGHVTTTP